MIHILSILLTFFIFPSTVFSAEKIIFASPERLPPKIFMENGVLRGTYIEIITAVCKRLKVEPVFVQYPWARAIAMVKSGKVHAIFPPFKTLEREEFLYFSTEPMGFTRNAIFARKARKIKINNLVDLKSLIVGINDQYSYGAEFDKFRTNLKLDISHTEEMQINKLAHIGQTRMDVAAASEETFKFLSRNMGFEKDFERIYVFSEQPSYVAFSKALGVKNKKLALQFSQILKQLRKEGVIQKINEHYFK
jgi:polar amino acid transport system substrate-binding protein